MLPYIHMEMTLKGVEVQVKEIQAKTILTPQKVGALSSYFDYSLNPYAGCAFRCSYCYVPKFPNAKHGPEEWGSWVEVKMNAAELLQKERQKIFGSRIFFSSATDPYQYVELKYRLSRRCLQELLRYQPARVTMHTRSHLILQDIDILKAFGDRLRVGVSITTDIEDIRAEFEPSAPSFARRIELVKTLTEAGVRVYASVSPLLPCNPDNFIATLKPYISHAWVDEMNWKEVNNRPWLLDKYKEFFGEPQYSRLCTRLQRAFNAAF
jgi:DNA repair photolyase